jgi:methionine sulfoxide reductase heme-binding subunit
MQMQHTGDRLIGSPIKLFGWGAALLLVCSVMAVWRMPDVEGVRWLIRTTARTSLLFFVLAYTAQALWVLRPGMTTKWLRQHRRQWGWLLVVSHGIHALAIGALSQWDPVLFDQLSPLGNRITGGLAYLIIALMGLTSFDRTAAWLGRTNWSRLHTWGSHYLWLSFLVAFGKRMPDSWMYGLPVLVLMLAMGLRWQARRATRRVKPS